MSLWYEEFDQDGLKYGYQIEKILFEEQSKFQKISVIETKTYGRALLIDDLVMITENDEFVYHELISHIPALLHKKPSRVVVIGGGDGGTVREMLRHPEIENITLCEIDSLVVETSHHYFPEVSAGLTDPRVEVMIGDGIEYVSNLPKESVDLMIIDSTDPIGPGEGLFTKEFYRNAAASLKADGLLCAQTESPWHSRESISRIHNNLAGGFSFVRPFIGVVPTYPRGLWSWSLASKHPVDPQAFSTERLESFEDQLKYLNREVLPAAFALPNFFKEKLKGC